jgi:hypothetical protein
VAPDTFTKNDPKDDVTAIELVPLAQALLCSSSLNDFVIRCDFRSSNATLNPTPFIHSNFSLTIFPFFLLGVLNEQLARRRGAFGAATVRQPQAPGQHAQRAKHEATSSDKYCPNVGSVRHRIYPRATHADHGTHNAGCQGVSDPLNPEALTPASATQKQKQHAETDKRHHVT